MRSLPRAAAVAAAMMVICGHSLAQDYPTRTVTLVVPYPPGGGVDAMARVVGEKLAGALGRPRFRLTGCYGTWNRDRRVNPP